MFSRSLVFVTALILCASAPTAIRAATDGPPADAAIAHVLNRLAYGPRPGDLDHVRAIGIQKWIENQLSPSRVDNVVLDGRLQRLQTLTLDAATIQRDYSGPAMVERRQSPRQGPGSRQPSDLQRKDRKVIVELEEAKLLRAVYSERQLEEVLVDFWFNHFNVHAGKGATRNYVGEYERNAIRPYVFGRFRDMLGATAKSPAMLFYLDNWLSAGAAGASGSEGCEGAGGRRQ